MCFSTGLCSLVYQFASTAVILKKQQQQKDLSWRKQGKKMDFLEYEVLRGLVFFTLADKYGSYYF